MGVAIAIPIETVQTQRGISCMAETLIASLVTELLFNETDN